MHMGDFHGLNADRSYTPKRVLLSFMSIRLAVAGVSESKRDSVNGRKPIQNLNAEREHVHTSFCVDFLKEVLYAMFEVSTLVLFSFMIRPLHLSL